MMSREASSVSVIEKTLIASYIAYSKIGLIRMLEAWPMMLIGELMPTISVLKRLTLRYSLQFGRFVKNKTSSVFHFVYRR
jgi:hypothetical protein